MASKYNSSQFWYGLFSTGLATTIGGAAYLYHKNHCDLSLHGNIALANSKRQAVFTWGATNQGQLGLGHDSNCSTSCPQPTMIPELDDIPVKQIDAFH